MNFKFQADVDWLSGFKDGGYFSFPEMSVMTGGSLIVCYPSNVFKHMNTPNPSFKS